MSDTDKQTRRCHSLGRSLLAICLVIGLRGYYAWPREVAASELAETLNITTSTLHEHIQKIEAKVLNE
ncbi:helix-turn-helix domain-containing protein [Salinigranum rubrum]|uniref:helix-turn-helix domain-containing protein n=1 Tax=Salinigranum rubrum TaxID=755307 RepID=UPI002AA2A895|nr:helix-turn-helix domain-containing protein [Salinigranum rubrum]